ncbi:MAG: hypothetical protein IJT36_06540 [Alphaproteobacteria bacterium]|nr:hypothetical protein [Alphaproteobacteria bacterium]
MKRLFVAHGQFVIKWKLVANEQLFAKWKLIEKEQFVAKIKQTKCRYYMLKYYPYEYPSKMKRSEYLLKKTKYLPEEMIDYPPPWALLLLLENGLNDICIKIFPSKKQ